MRLTLLLAIIILTHFNAAGQKSTVRAEVSGVVIDSTSKKPLRTASVSLVMQRDSAYVMASITDGDGKFRFKNVSTGSYRLLVTFIGYRNKSALFTLSLNSAVRLDTLWMSEQGNDLQEVVIKQEAPPVALKGDTVQFNADAFKTEPNAQLEELLKKLPGVEVSRDGEIKSNGQAVRRVFVDGKPFFGDDPKMATRNLPADIVDKVQVYDQSSDQSQFSGMDDGNRERTINITIKKDKGKGYFGQNSIGAGRNTETNAMRYQGKLSLNRFNNRNGGPGRQISLVGQANNLNQQNFSLGDGSLPGGGMGGPMFIGQPGSFGNENGQTPTSITKVTAGGFNYRAEGEKVRYGKRAEISASYFANKAVTTTDQKSRREYILPGQSFFTDQSNYNRNQAFNQRFNGRFEFQLDSLTSIRLTPNISWQNVRYNSDLSNFSYSKNGDSLNAGETHYRSAGNGLNGYNNLILMRKFGKLGRTMSANLNTVLSDGRNTGYNQSRNMFYDSLGLEKVISNIDQQNRQNSFSAQNNLSFSFTEPLSFRQKLEVRYAWMNSQNRQSRFVFDKNEETNSFSIPDSVLTNRFAGTFTAHKAGATLQTQRLRFNYTLGFDVQRSKQLSDNLSQDSRIDKQFVHWLPNALFSYTFSGNRRARLQYRTRIAPASVTQLQPVIDNTNPLDIKSGNPALRPEYFNTLTLTYNSSESSGDRSLFIFANLNQSNSRINNATTISDNGARFSKPINTEGYWALNSFLSWSKNISALKFGLTLNTQANVSAGQSLINNLKNQAKTTLLGQGIRIQSAFDGTIDYGFGARISYQRASYSLLPQQNTQYWSQYMTADLHWQLPFRFVFSSDLTYTGNTGRTAGFNQKFTLWNAALSRQFLKGKQGEIRLQVFDILNQNRSLARNTTETYIEDVQSIVLKRYFLVSFVYNLRKFGI
ncbi:TonB-dependent receptor [Dyadobacter psychrophilus]|uniref:Outer membrane receptor proteins, mostly Fe transport n=1 Tax=Dyadobacter psychrophilus TaxID=651661 RepID=A0A1T5E0U0_9BACT|nr:TonB-dependent receptor [Dyadobacter psychrophilus]SKB77587.1 Outer membrane receptor proteins, mostly Fe transport [Dyadobacter psychrophilus]